MTEYKLLMSLSKIDSHMIVWAGSLNLENVSSYSNEKSNTFHKWCRLKPSVALSITN